MKAKRPSPPAIPLRIKDSTDWAWPEDEPIFYLLSRDGLFLARNGELFRSCVPAPRGPSALAPQGAFLVPDFPRVPRALFEQVVGFFARVAALHGSEAAALLVWDRAAQRVRIVVPEQRATVHRSWDGYRSAIGVHYQPPADLPADWLVYGDVHSHVHGPAYASGTDVEDEAHSAGLHVVVGRIANDPPEIHVEAVADGTRFRLELADAVEGYRQRRRDFPAAWLDRVRVQESHSLWSAGRAS